MSFIPPQITESRFVKEAPDMYGVAKDLLTILIIPALLWVNSMSSEVAVLVNRIEALEGSSIKHEERLTRIMSNITVQDRELGQRIVRLEARVETMNARFDRIEALLDQLLSKQTQLADTLTRTRSTVRRMTK